ncbi:hypothetical protein D9758_012476 [Tetrapyrgos nigripes]|uniref:Ubiquitin-like protease family profile domain-containing protein n=1 Tax=Tetrapyrgos nigripes TaxID=182062 RepID=A0A8H5CYH3_9AGAR|nr:hypothetical protein D9758_012476 [Tetrapyrgos nigripes]
MEPTHGVIELPDEPSHHTDTLTIPEEFLPILLPPPSCSIIDLTNFTIPAVDNPDTPALDPSHFTSGATLLNTPPTVRILRSQPVPSLTEIHALISLVPGAVAQGHHCLKRQMHSTLTLTQVPSQMNLPLWVLSYWEIVHNLWIHKKTWTMVQDWLKIMGGTTFDLAKFLSDSWLGDVQVAQMVAQLRSQKMDDRIWLMNNYWSNKLVVGYRKQERILVKTGDALKEGSIKAIAFPVFIRLGTSVELPSEEARGNHWVAVVVDVAGRSILYRDSMQHPAPNELISAIQWWLSDWGTVSDNFKVDNLPCGRQTNNESCALYAINTLAGYVTPLDFPIYDKKFSPNKTRYQTFQTLVKYFNDTNADIEPAVPETTTTTTDPIPIHPFFAPKSRKAPKIARSETKRKREEMVNVGVKIRKTAENDDRSDEDSSDDEDSGDEPMGDEEDTPRREIVLLPVNGTCSTGAPRKAILNKLLLRCRYSNDPTTRSRYKCVGEGCIKFHSNRSQQRALKHAIQCPLISPDLKVEVQRIMVDRAPSSVVEKLQTERNTPAASEPAMKTGTLDREVRLGRKERLIKRKAVLDLGVTKLFCVGNFAGLVADLPVWRELWMDATPDYTPPTCNMLLDDLIPSEAAKIISNNTALLKKERNLTISFDGGTRHRKSHWTVHISEQNRSVHLMEVNNATNKRHTKEWVRDLALRWMREIGETQFCAVVSDSTGNTLGARLLLANAIPTLLALADICHHCNNTSKDIVKIAYFAKAVKVVRATLQKFHQSNHASFLLDRANEAQLQKVRGLEAIGKTRFSTVTLSALSVQRNSPIIRIVVESDESLQDWEYASIFQSSLTRASQDFEFVLKHLIDIGMPLARALACLEANDANPADVFLYWHALIFEIEQTVTNKKSEYLKEVQDEILSILDYRHNQLFIQGGQLYNAVYLATAYLNPVYLRSQLFRNNDPDPTQPLDEKVYPPLQGIRHHKIFWPVAHFLFEVACNEVKHGSNKFFTKWVEYGKEFSEQFRDELQAYAQSSFPFNAPIDNDYVAIKLVSIRVNSMADERTGSTLTWMTPALRNRMSVEAMGARTVVKQHYSQSKPRSKRVKFCDIKKDFEDPDTRIDEEDDSWLDEQEADPADPDADGENDSDMIIDEYVGVARSFITAANIVNPDAFEIVSLLKDSAIQKASPVKTAEVGPKGSRSSEFVLWPGTKQV